MEPKSSTEEEREWEFYLLDLDEESWNEVINPPRVPVDSTPCEPFPYDLPF